MSSQTVLDYTYEIIVNKTLISKNKKMNRRCYSYYNKWNSCFNQELLLQQNCCDEKWFH